MSGLAKILLEQGLKVSGSDMVLNQHTDLLGKMGAKIYQGHNEKYLAEDVDFVITTSAIKPDNPELLKAKRLGKTVMTRSQLLNRLISTEKKAIAITGTHGKTTTTSMLATILENAGLDPLAVVGADVKVLGGNAKNGNGDYSIAEVCEYQKAFLDIFPYAAIITNIDEDHLDCYKDIDDIIYAFAQFIGGMHRQGFLIINGEDGNIKKAVKGYTGEIITFGLGPGNDWQAVGVETQKHKSKFTVTRNGGEVGRFELIIPGVHNILNALASIALAKELGINNDIIHKSLADFSGASRRFEIKGEKKGILIIDDYGHHPTEIEATLAGARQFYKGHKIVAVFQPHQHSRTKFLLKEFSEAFENADKVLVPEIYAVRDTDEDIKSVSSKDLVDLINEKIPGKAQFFFDFEDTIKYLRKNMQKGDIIITIGAGPVNKVGEEILAC